jgi:hypothetical protein
VPTEATVTLAPGNSYTGVTIQAAGGHAFPNWSLQLTLPGVDAYFGMNANVQTDGGVLTAQGQLFNTDISSGGSVSFSYVGSGSITNASGCELNGAPCRVVVQS